MSFTDGLLLRRSMKGLTSLRVSSMIITGNTKAKTNINSFKLMGTKPNAYMQDQEVQAERHCHGQEETWVDPRRHGHQ